MRHLTSCVVRTGTWLLVLGVCAVGCRDEPPRGDVAPDDMTLGAAIADIEAGRTTTPLIAASAGDADATVTFLAKRDGARVPRIVSDVTGWGDTSTARSISPSGRWHAWGRRSGTRFARASPRGTMSRCGLR